MTNKEIEKQIKEEIEAATPNNLNKIIEKCESMDGSAKIIELPKQKSKHIAYRRYVSLAAAFLLVFTIGVASVLGIVNSGDGSIIALDVNPGIEITLNKQDKIKSLSATNDDGKEILDGLNVKGMKLDKAIDEIISKLIEKGYLSTDANSVLVSVDCKNATDTEKLEEIVTKAISNRLSTNGVEASVLTQVVTRNDEIKALADKYNMSDGKARLIYELVKKGGKHTFEELSTLTINELSILLRETSLLPKDVNKHGEASKNAYISEEEALQSALKAAGAVKTQVSGIDVELDYVKKGDDKRGAMIYDIEFIFDGKEYDFDIDARNGEILKKKTELIEHEDKHTFEKSPRPDDIIGKEKAIEAARKEGFDPSRADDFDSDLDCDRNGNWFYEFEFSIDNREEKIKIDANTGKIIK